MRKFKFRFFDGSVYTASGDTPRDALYALGLEAYNPVSYKVEDITDIGATAVVKGSNSGVEKQAKPQT